MDVLQPRLSWVLQPRDPAARGLRQTAYQIHVASSPEMLAEGKTDLWDSGREVTDTTSGPLVMLVCGPRKGADH